MPAYLTHAVMGDNLYDICSKDENLFKFVVDRDSLKTFSCGLDMAEVFKSKYVHDHHNFKTQEFLLSMVKYIKENNFTQDGLMLSFLYGHMSHLFLDASIHPLVYYIGNNCKQVGLISPHYVIEGFISAYLIEKILNNDIMDIHSNFFNRGKILDSKIVNIVNYLFKNVYNERNVILSYKLFILMLSFVEFCSKNIFTRKELLVKLFSFEKFLYKNNLTRDEIVNSNNEYWINPFTGEMSNDSILNLYNKALENTIYAMYEVNKFLYDGNSITSLKKVFPLISYDTGVSLSLGKKIKFYRK